ncbi:hypothetical protein YASMINEVIRUS_1199 [Yasminevirus sp. GU-2018]|uniref:Uncharacterized protein n=1 Tax=Yasminevirus sp. GU-2018 TaxID=2420051 RepID=A0A5K0U9H9_9VIRU|nr:hypothetical protein YASMINEVIRUS_1199 [Yasminevirus sp. GU-2018]
MMNVLYHGSAKHLTVLEPRPSRVIDNEKAVFATDSKDLAVVFIPRWSDCDMDLGYHNNILYCSEQYPNAFDKLKGISGFIYQVDKSLFTSDKRLGMQHHEFICKTPVTILSEEKIDDVFSYLMKSSICMITYDQKLDAMEAYGLIKQK